MVSICFSGLKRLPSTPMPYISTSPADLASLAMSSQVTSAAWALPQAAGAVEARNPATTAVMIRRRTRPAPVSVLVFGLVLGWVSKDKVMRFPRERPFFPGRIVRPIRPGSGTASCAPNVRLGGSRFHWTIRGRDSCNARMTASRRGREKFPVPRQKARPPAASWSKDA
ncbi:protein of unknown function (plasmid) [Azospirillum baldaniorum]|uniref:Uncharacterized protein n=1 Tax=Azospirillum baldaniorum TaxID=1064539 RepID=A0A9P1JZG3_9PROT|nr:protein of unknown function [Azospirillum baldaniorum]